MHSIFFTTTLIVLSALPAALGVLLVPHLAAAVRAGMIGLMIAMNAFMWLYFQHGSAFIPADVPMNVRVMSTLARCACVGIGAHAATWIIQWFTLAWQRNDPVDPHAQLVERVHPIVGLTVLIAWWQSGAWQPAFAPILPGIEAAATPGSGLDADAVLRAIDTGLQTVVRSAWPILVVHTGLLLPAAGFGRSAGSDGARRLIAIGALPALWAAAPVHGAWAIEGLAAALRAGTGAS